MADEGHHDHHTQSDPLDNAKGASADMAPQEDDKYTCDLNPTEFSEDSCRASVNNFSASPSQAASASGWQGACASHHVLSSARPTLSRRSSVQEEKKQLPTLDEVLNECGKSRAVKKPQNQFPNPKLPTLTELLRAEKEESKKILKATSQQARRVSILSYGSSEPEGDGHNMSASNVLGLEFQKMATESAPTQYNDIPLRDASVEVISSLPEILETPQSIAATEAPTRDSATPQVNIASSKIEQPGH